MLTRGHKALVVCVLALLCVALSGGCQDLKYHRIYMSAAGGAAIGLSRYSKQPAQTPVVETLTAPTSVGPPAISIGRP